MYPSLGDRVRVASREELEQAFCGDRRNSVRVGCIRQDPSISANVRVDDLLGKHFAIVGTTGTGKSCTTALILRAILQKHPAAHMVLLDPHNEYAPAFGEWAEVISQRNMQLPYWLLTFEELIEVLIGNPQERKAEVEMLQDLIPMAKARYGAGRGNTREAGLRKGADIKYTVDTPVPYRISDLIQTIDDRMGKLENKRDLSPYRNLKTRLEMITLDPRYAFMFGSLTVYDSMAQILGRIFRVPVNDKPITIFELTGLPTEIINVVVSVLCRMTFDFAAVERRPGAGDAGVRGSAPLRPCQRQSRLRALQARHRQDRQGRPQVRRLAVHRHAAARPRSTPPSCPSATPCSRCACRTTATRRSSSPPLPTPAPGCSSS